MSVDMEAKYDRRQMVRLICEGLSSYQIAARIGTTPSTVRKAARQLKQQQAGTYKPRGREFYSERLIDLVPKRTKIDDAKSATVKANRLPLIAAAMEKRRGNLPVADVELPVIDHPSVYMGDDYAAAEFGHGKVLITGFPNDESMSGCRALVLTELKTPGLIPSEIPSPKIVLMFYNRASALTMIEFLTNIAKGFDQ